MNSTPRVAVTGASGGLGGRVARRLAGAGVPQVLVTRGAGRAPQLPDAQEAVASYAEPDALRAALTGVDTLLLVSGEEAPDRVAQHTAAIDAAVSAGVRRIVYTSFLGAAPDATFTLAREHAATERHLRAAGVSWTVLRDGMYQDMFPLMVGDDGVLRGPAADGRVSAVSRDDVADVAASVLLAQAPAFDGEVLELTGPEALSLDQVAQQLTAAVGRPIRYRPESVDEAYASRVVFQAPKYLVDGWVTSYTAIAAGELAAVTDTVQRVTGHPATSLEQFLARNPQALAGLRADPSA